MRMLIDGEWVDASDAGTMEVRNPATGGVVATVPLATVEDAGRAVRAAQVAKEEMARLPAHERASILFRTAEWLHGNSVELARYLSAENGKPIRETEE